ELLAEAQAIVRECERRGRLGPYQLQAAIHATHAAAPAPGATDWARIVRLYDQLLLRAPGPAVALGRAVAVAEAQGPEAGLDALESIDLERSHHYHAARADMLARLGRRTEAMAACTTAIACCGNERERDFLHQRLVELACS